MTILTNEDVFTPTYLSLKKVTNYLTYIIIAGAILYVVIRTAYSIYKLNKTNSLKLTAIKALQIFGCLLGTCLFTMTYIYLIINYFNPDEIPRNSLGIIFNGYALVPFDLEGILYIGLIIPPILIATYADNRIKKILNEGVQSNE